MVGSALGLGSSFGIMQGRLSPQSERGYQAFPWDTWNVEFALAAKRHLEHIEWVLDSWQVAGNPLLSDTRSVSERSQTTGVKIISVCADYLMDRPLDASDAGSWEVLHRLVDSMQGLGSEWLVVPCVDQSSLREGSSLRRFLRAAETLVEVLRGTRIRVSLESDLGPDEFAALLGHLEPEVIGVNYDIGNSASLGYSYQHELDAYGTRVSLLHVKDRTFRGGSVMLGQGNADIPGVFRRLTALKFNGPVTMQAFRDHEGLVVADAQLEWLRQLMA